MKVKNYETLRFTFGPSDIQELGQRLARETQNVYDLEARKKEISAEMAAQIKAANTRVSETTGKLNNGYEMREAEVWVEFDVPQRGVKRIVRADDGELLREEPMSAAELQRGFGFAE